MATFVLVHGAWHGAWCYSRVLPLLRQAGHTAFAANLTGVGERAHLLRRDISLQTHIQDVVSLIETEELQDVILAVHSYAGMVGTGVADRMASRLKHLVYIDASVPLPGEAWGDKHLPQTRAARAKAASEHPQNALPPPDASVFGLSGEDAAWVNRRQTPHPFGPYTEGLPFDMARVAGIARTFIDCDTPALATIAASRVRAQSADTWGGAWLPKSRYLSLHTGHDAMVSDPQGLTDILLSCV
jgi:pimeloyl-ACP methyl ester carboxylesterase